MILLTNILYGSSHGPYSDDEINIIEGFKKLWTSIN